MDPEPFEVSEARIRLFGNSSSSNREGFVKEDREMFDSLKNADSPSTMARQMRPRTKLERLRDMKQGLESKLEEVNTVISLLESNPELVKIIDALEKVNV